MSHLSKFCDEKAHSRQQINDAPFGRETSNDKSSSVRRSADRWVEADFKWRDQCSAGNEDRSYRNKGRSQPVGATLAVLSRNDQGHTNAGMENVEKELFLIDIVDVAV